MILLVKSGGETAVPAWQAAFREAAPQLSVHWWSDPAVAREDVAYVLVWQPEPGWLARLPNLRLICSSAAGVDHITRDPDWPAHLSIVRMGGHETSQRMGEYVALGALSLLRDFKRVVTAQAARRWDYFENPRNATSVRAGVMGMGNLGAHAACVLRGLGFITAGWSQTRKSIDGIESFAGADEFDAFLARTDILVCLLPDTPATRGIIDARAIALLPKGAGIVNAGRGGHLVTADLIAALDSGHLGGAFLDVFDVEPLPEDDVLWTHPNVIVTPHLASLASIPERARYVAGVIAAFEAGEALPNLYVPERGY
jgi:glyoxylate/hydroxypyruvate reductase A